MHHPNFRYHSSDVAAKPSYSDAGSSCLSIKVKRLLLGSNPGQTRTRLGGKPRAVSKTTVCGLGQIPYLKPCHRSPPAHGRGVLTSVDKVYILEQRALSRG